MSMLDAVWRAIGTVLEPFAGRYLAGRARTGKEDPARLSERTGVASHSRPPGRLVWLHAASVGETMAVLPLTERLGERAGGATILLTTGTTTSADLVARQAPAGVLHQYAPLDGPGFVARFLDHWQPDAAIRVESEIWPTTIATLRRRGVPIAIINARLSEKSFRGWRRVGPIGRPMFASLSLVAAQTGADAARFEALGAPAVAAGNLKADAPPLPVDEAAFAALRDCVGDRPVWLAASTHPGEEAIIADTHRIVAEDRSDLLTILAPRHPERGGAVLEETSRRARTTIALRSRGEAPDPGVGLYVADTLGELGLFYRLSPIAFLGGSLVPVGGHNPFEPAALGAALLTGPHTFNFRDAFGALADRGAVIAITDGETLASAVSRLLGAPSERAALASAAAAILAEGAGASERVLDLLAPILAQAVQTAAAEIGAG